MIGQIIKYMRVNKGYTQKELADKLNIAQTTLSGYETNYSNPIFSTIEEIAELCDYEIIFINRREKKKITLKSINKEKGS